MEEYDSLSLIDDQVQEFLEFFPFPTRNVEWYIPVDTGEHRVTFEWKNWYGDWIPADRSLDEE